MRPTAVAALLIPALLAASSSAAGQEADPRYPGAPRTFTGRHLSEIEYPIGGIGTGNVLLGGRGQIEHLELVNRPNRLEVPTATFFALWFRTPGGEPRAVLLERQLLPPVQHAQRKQLAGLPRCREAVFDGTYPFARLSFEDERVPVEVRLEAWNPYVPLEPEWSGFPAALFDWQLANPTDGPIEVSVAFSMQNPIEGMDEEGQLRLGGNVNRRLEEPGLTGVHFTSERNAPGDYAFGDITMATTSNDAAVSTRWYRGGWWDDAHVFWRDFAADGRPTASSAASASRRASSLTTSSPSGPAAAAGGASRRRTAS